MKKQQQFLITTLIITCLVAFIPTYIYAQRADTTSFYTPLSKPCLKPIVIGSNGKYYYDGRRLRNSHSLEIPFGEMDDPIVNKYYKNARIMRGVGSFLTLAPTIYWLATARNSYNRNTFWAFYIGSLTSSIVLTFVAEGQVRKAVRTYNNKLGQVKIGMSIQDLPNNSIATGVGISAKF